MPTKIKVKCDNCRKIITDCNYIWPEDIGETIQCPVCKDMNAVVLSKELIPKQIEREVESYATEEEGRKPSTRTKRNTKPDNTYP